VSGRTYAPLRGSKSTLRSEVSSATFSEARWTTPTTSARARMTSRSPCSTPSVVWAPTSRSTHCSPSAIWTTAASTSSATPPTSSSTERRSRPTSRRRMQLRRSLQRSCFLAPVWASRESRDCAGGFAAPRRLPPHSNEQLSPVTFRRGARTNVLAPLVAVGLGFGANTRGPMSQGFQGVSEQAQDLPQARTATQPGASINARELCSESIDRRSITVKGLFIWLLAASLAAFALPNDAAAADCTDRTSLPATPDG